MPQYFKPEFDDLLVRLEKEKGSIELHRVLVLLLHKYKQMGDAEILANTILP